MGCQHKNFDIASFVVYYFTIGLTIDILFLNKDTNIFTSNTKISFKTFVRLGLILELDRDRHFWAGSGSRLIPNTLGLISYTCITFITNIKSYF